MNLPIELIKIKQREKKKGGNSSHLKSIKEYVW